MECKDCGGTEFWDNRASKTNPKQPDFRCKGCKKGIWLKGKAAGVPGAGNRGQGSGSLAGGAPKRPLGPLYYDCLKVAKACVEKEIRGALPADIIAATATLFIAASQDGTPLTAPKPKPAPPPEPEYDDQDQRYIEEDAGDSSLPF